MDFTNLTTKTINYDMIKSRGVPCVDFLAYSFKNLNFNFDIKKRNFLNCYSLCELFVRDNLAYLLPDPIYMYLFENHLLDYDVIQSYGMGYRLRLSFPGLGINIFICGVTPGHGVHVVLSGSILSRVCIDREDLIQFNNSIETKIDYLFDSYLEYDSIFEVYDSYVDWDGKVKTSFNRSDVSLLVSRIDIAYDFEVDYIEFYNRIRSGKFQCRSKLDANYNIDSYNHGTIYLGARSSPFFVRIYDKAKEIKDKMHKMLGFVYEDVPENYTRVEFEIKNHGRCNYAHEAFLLFLKSSEDIGNLCFSYLKIYDDEDKQNLWHVYESVILYNNDEFTIEYNKSYQTSINLCYLQNCANTIVTYCRRLPGLVGWLKKNFSESKSAINKTRNIDFDFDVLYDTALQIENDQEKIILDYLTFFDSDITV